MRQALGPSALGRPRGIGWRGRWEGGSGWGTHVNPWLIHFNIWQNPLQLKKKKESSPEPQLKSNKSYVVHGVWDLSSSTRDQARIPCIGRQILNHWTTREVMSNVVDLKSPDGFCRGDNGCDLLFLCMVAPGLKVTNNILIKWNWLFEGGSQRFNVFSHLLRV